MLKALWAILYSAIAAVLMVAYTHTPDLSRFIFSLGAVLTGIRFFRNYETKAMRISFIVSAIFLYFLFSVIYVFIAYAYGLPYRRLPEG